MRIFLTEKRMQKFEPVQHALVPRSKDFTPEERQRGINLINELLLDKSVAIQMKLSLFLTLIYLFSLLRKGRVFSRLNETSKIKILNTFFDSPISIFRKGFWALNTLAKLSVYGQYQLYDEFGYELQRNQSGLQHE